MPSIKSIVAFLRPLALSSQLSALSLALFLSAIPAPAQQTTALVDAFTGELKRPTAAQFASANSLLTSAQVNGYFADPSTNGSFSASAWKADLAIAQADVAGLTTADTPTFGGLISPTLSSDSLSITATGLMSNVFLKATNGGTVSVGLETDLPSSGPALAPFPMVIGNSGVATNLALVSYGFYTSIRGFAANGSVGSPSPVVNNQGLLTLFGSGYDGSTWFTGGAYIAQTATENWNSSAHGSKIEFYVANKGTASAVRRAAIFDFGAMLVGSSDGTTTAWTTDGVVFRTQTGRTWTDSSSTGTVSSVTAFSSFSVPTISAPLTANYNLLANVYIAGDPATTGNASLSATGVSYGLYNVGKLGQAGLAYFYSQANFQRGTNLAIRLGADTTATTITNNTVKVGRIGVPQYATANADFLAFSGQSTSSDNQVLIGGGTSAYNSATLIQFFTAGNQTTTTGTEVMRLNNGQEVQIGSTTDLGAYKLQVTGNSIFTGSLRTGAPSGGTANDWKFGTVSVTSPTSPNRTIELEVGGTTYYLAAKTTNN